MERSTTGLILAVLATGCGAASSLLQVAGARAVGAEVHGLVYLATLASASTFLACSGATRTNKWGPATVRDVRSLSWAAAAAAAYIIGHLLLFKAAEIVTPLELSVAGRTYLIFSVALALLAARTLPTPFHLGCLVAFTAASLLIVDAQDALGLIGLSLAVATYALFALYNFALSTAPRIGPDAANAVCAAVTFVILAALSYPQIEAGILHSRVSLLIPAASGVLYAISHSLMYRSLRTTDYLTVSYIRAGSPIFVVLFAFVFAMDSVGTRDIVGIFGVVACQALWIAKGRS